MSVSVPRDAAPSIHIERARFAFAGRRLFDDLSLDLPAGRTTCLLGPSGVGKTSLLRLIAGLLPPEPPTRIAAADGRPLAGRVAWMAQTDLLMPWLDALGNVLIGYRLRGDAVALEAARERALGLLAQTGLAGRESDLPATLSGGMRQRVALARTLVEERPVVLMDEPFGQLDAITRLSLQDLAARMLAGRTVLLVTHDPLEAARLGHRIHVMAGAPASLGTPLEPAGDLPRDATAAETLRIQADLMHHLADAHAFAVPA
jgi:putative hydroxymethylpyrimidine transport system ATP-binding protein